VLKANGLEFDQTPSGWLKLNVKPLPCAVSTRFTTNAVIVLNTQHESTLNEIIIVMDPSLMTEIALQQVFQYGKITKLLEKILLEHKLSLGKAKLKDVSVASCYRICFLTNKQALKTRLLASHVEPDESAYLVCPVQVNHTRDGHDVLSWPCKEWDNNMLLDQDHLFGWIRRKCLFILYYFRDFWWHDANFSILVLRKPGREHESVEIPSEMV
jgi:hypothetical protein